MRTIWRSIPDDNIDGHQSCSSVLIRVISFLGSIARRRVNSQKYKLLVVRASGLLYALANFSSGQVHKWAPTGLETKHSSINRKCKEFYNSKVCFRSSS
jgi:hypothetical protein